MQSTYLCPHCGTPNRAQATRCKRCGEAIPPGGGVRETLFELDRPATSIWYWNVVLLTFGAVVAVQVLMGLVVTPKLLAKLVPPGAIMTATVLGLGALVYFFAGLLAGRLSSEFTVKEPAVGGLLAAALNWGLEAYLFQNTVFRPTTAFDLVVLAAVAVGWGILCAFGASAGETLQQRAEKRRRDQFRAQQAKG